MERIRKHRGKAHDTEAVCCLRRLLSIQLSEGIENLDAGHPMEDIAFLVLFLALPFAAVLLMHTDYPERAIYSASRHISHERRRQAFRAYHDFRHAVYIMGKQPLMVFRAFVESGLSLTFIYMTVPCYFTALKFHFDWILTMGRLYLLNLVLYFTPTPGGSGIAEGGFVLLFSETVPAGTVGIVAVCWRLIAEYIPFLIGLYYTLTVFGRDFLNRQLNK